MAERLFGTSNRDATLRTFRARHRAQRAASQETYVVVSRLLPPVANTPVLERRCAARTPLASSGTLRRSGIPSRPWSSPCLSSKSCVNFRERQASESPGTRGVQAARIAAKTNTDRTAMRWGSLSCILHQSIMDRCEGLGLDAVACTFLVFAKEFRL